MKKLKYTIKCFLNKFIFLKVYFSPFKPLKLKFYAGKITIGTPYFLPRKWIKGKSQPKKIGFDFVALGWKTKWHSDDYRFEWSPLWSFVFFKWQVVLFFVAPEQCHYWEAWLYYNYSTDKKKSKKQRIEQCKKEFSLKYIVHENGNVYNVDYYNKILK